MNLEKIEIEEINNKSNLYIFNNDDKILIDHIIKKRNIHHGLILKDNVVDLLKSIIYLYQHDDHKKSYILFKNYNIFLNNINNSHKKDYNTIINYNYNIKFFLIDNFDLDFMTKDYIFIQVADYISNFKLIHKRFNVLVEQCKYYDYIVIHNNEVYYYNLDDSEVIYNNNKKRCNIDIIEDNFKRIKLDTKINKKRIMDDDYNHKKKLRMN